MLASRSLQLPELKAETLDLLYRDADAKITRRGLTILSYVLVRRGILQKPLGRDGQIERQESIAHRRVLDGVPVVWREWCERWFGTTTLQPSSRIGGLYRLFNVGRWLAQSGYGSEPADWTREVAAAYVAAVDRATIGQWSTLTGAQRLQAGQPFKPPPKRAHLLPFDASFETAKSGAGFRRGSTPTRRLRHHAPCGALSGQTRASSRTISGQSFCGQVSTSRIRTCRSRTTWSYVVTGTSTRRPWSRLWRLCGCSLVFAATRSPGSVSAAFAGRMAKYSRTASQCAFCMSRSTRPERHSPSLSMAWWDEPSSSGSRCVHPSLLRST